MSVGLILAAMVFQFLVWLWVCAGIAEDGWRRILGAFALQFWGLLGLHFLVGANSADALLWLIFAPLGWLIAFGNAVIDQSLFAVSFLPIPALVALVVFWLLFRRPTTRIYSFGISLLVLFLGAHVSAEIVSRTAMCRQAEQHGMTDFKRNTFIWSLRNTPDEFQFEIHAIARLGDRRFGWSYREMDWYELQPDTWGKVNADVFNCSQ